MGMSADFEAAIQLGATHVRVGSAIFGAREPEPAVSDGRSLRRELATISIVVRGPIRSRRRRIMRRVDGDAAGGRREVRARRDAGRWRCRGRRTIGPRFQAMSTTTS